LIRENVKEDKNNEVMLNGFLLESIFENPKETNEQLKTIEEQKKT